MDNYKIEKLKWVCMLNVIGFNLCSVRQMFIIDTNIVKHTYLPVVSITEIIEYYKNGYLSTTVGTRLHLASG